MPEKPQSVENPYFIRERLSEQEQALVEGVEKITRAIAAIELNPDYGVEPQAVIVGGFVRDIFMGLKPKDADVEVYGVAPEVLSKTLIELFPHVDGVGEAFGVLKVGLGGGLEIDVSIPRRESKKGSGHRGFEVHGDPSLDMVEAARRRDFSMNALSMEPLTGVVFDPFGGLEDIKNRILRVTDPERFGDDALRVLRAAQFVARFGLKVEPKSFDLMKEIVAGPEFHIISTDKKSSEAIGLAAGRFAEEWSKLLFKGQEPSRGLELMRRLGIFEKIYPEVAAWIAGEGGEEKWRSVLGRLDSVRQKLKVNGKDLPKETPIMILMATFCQDFDRSIVEKFLHESRLTFSKKDFLIPATALSREMNSLDNTEELDDRQFAGRLVSVLERLKTIDSEIYLIAYEANALEPEQEQKGKIVSRARELVRKYGLSAAPLVGGKDIMEIAPDFKPGKEMGQILEQIKQKRRTGEIIDADEARAALRKLLKQ